MTSPATAAAEDEIRRLVFDHFHAVDVGDIELQADYFAEAEVRYVRGGAVLLEAHDRASFLAQISSVRIHEDGTPGTHHAITNLVVDVEDDSHASSRCYSTVFQATGTGQLAAIACGVFEDRFVRSAGGWRFASRIGRLRLVGDLSGHVPPSSSVGERLDAAGR